jgi:hypothetical protein
VAFPILLANLTGELLGGSGAPVDAVSPGTPVTLPLPLGAVGLRVERPDGSTVDLAPGTAGGASVSFSQTDQLGVYVVTVIRGSDPPPSPSPSLTPSPTPAATASPAASGGQSPRPSGSPAATPKPSDPNRVIRFAVDLFDVDESNIAPGQASRLVALGGGMTPSPDPGASPSPNPSASPGASGNAEPVPSAVAGGGTTEPRPPARDELWAPILLLILLVLCVEWAVYQRDAVIRMWRAVNARLRRRPAGGA